MNTRTADEPQSAPGWRAQLFQLNADLFELEGLLREAEQPDLAAEARALRDRLAERRALVGVVGEFKRGKSTFINALLGEEVLPADVLPTTAVLHRVTYGLRPSLRLVPLDGGAPQSIDPAELAAWSTKLDARSAERAAALAEVVLSWPLRFCRNDVDLLDTPGLADEARMSERTRALLPSMDAAILVLSAISPFSEAEQELLIELQQQGLRRVLVVVNGVDRLRRPEDRERVLERVRQRCAERLGALDLPAPPVHPVSALEALQARQQSDGERLERSGMPALESALERWLIGADAAFLTRRTEAALELLGRLPIGPPAAPPEQPSLERLEGLLSALEPALEAGRRAMLDSRTRLSGLDELPRRFRQELRQAWLARLQRSPVAPTWPHSYPSFASATAEAIASVGRSELGRLLAELQQRLEALELEQSAIRAQLLRVSAEVLGFVELELSAQGWSPLGPSPRARLPEPQPGPAAPPPEVEPLAQELLPSEGRLREALLEPGLQSSLERYQKKSGFDRFIALDFSNLQQQWVGGAIARFDLACDLQWAGNRLEERLQQLADQGLLRAAAPLERALDCLRAARLELRAHAERARVRVEQQAQSQQRRGAAREALKLRLQAARHSLEVDGAEAGR